MDFDRNGSPEVWARDQPKSILKEVHVMKILRVLFILSVVAFLMSCSTAYNVKYDYSTGTNLAGLKTFDWMAVPAKAEINPLNVKRVKNAVNANLAAKGLTKTSDNPDFLIAAHMGKKDKTRITDWGYGYGRHGRYWGGARPVDVYQYEEGSLILDFVDAKSKQMIWRGSANAQLDMAKTPEKRLKIINEVVEKILEKFPPPASK